MTLTRRKVLEIGVGTFALSAVTGLPVFASATDEAIAALTGGADIAEGVLALTAPEIAENGNTVPIEVSAPGAVMVTLFADGNPVPAVASAAFGPLSPTRALSTRIRLATSQNVIAIAKMEDGTFQRASADVKVTIGGCGG